LARSFNANIQRGDKSTGNHYKLALAASACAAGSLVNSKNHRVEGTQNSPKV